MQNYMHGDVDKPMRFDLKSDQAFNTAAFKTANDDEFGPVYEYDKSVAKK